MMDVAAGSVRLSHISLLKLFSRCFHFPIFHSYDLTRNIDSRILNVHIVTHKANNKG